MKSWKRWFGVSSHSLKGAGRMRTQGAASVAGNMRIPTLPSIQRPASCSAGVVVHRDRRWQLNVQQKSGPPMDVRDERNSCLDNASYKMALCLHILSGQRWVNIWDEQSALYKADRTKRRASQ